MGSCCGNDLSIMGEDFILKLIHDPSLKLNQYDYTQLLSLIENKRINQEIYKIYIKDMIIPEFYDNKLIDPNTKYLNSIFSYILTQFEEKNNLYSVILMFYPFINHENEIIEETLFNIFHSINKGLTILDLENILFKYIAIFTQGLTYSVWKVCDEQDIANSLDDLNTNVYTDKQINILVKKMLDKLYRKSKTNLIITKELFIAMIRKYDISNIENIRGLFIKPSSKEE